MWKVYQNGAQNDDKNSSEIDYKTDNEKKQKTINFHVLGQTTLKYRKGHQFRGFHPMSMRTRRV